MELTIEQVLQQGVSAHKEGKLQDAERLYRAILQSQPAHPDANHNLGVLAVSVNKADAALPLFKSALEANPKIEQFWLSYIDALIKQQQFEVANQVINQAKNQGIAGEKLNVLEAQLAFKNKPENVKSVSPSQQQLSSLLEHYQNGRFSDAEKLALTLTQKYPIHPFSWKVLGAVLKQTGRITESLIVMQTSTQLAPQDTEAFSNLGNTLKELGKLEEAEASYIQAIALNPDNAEAHFNLGVILQSLGRLKEAEASYTLAKALKPNFAATHSHLGNTLKELGRLGEAEASYSLAIALRPDYPEAHSNLGVTLHELGRLDESEASYAQAIALKPDYTEAYNNLGIILQELGRLDEAEASYTQAIALKPDYAEAHNNLGTTLQELGRLDEAEASYTQAIMLQLNFAEAHNNLGVALKELGRLEEAEASCRQAIFLKTDFALAHSNLGKILYATGDKSSALSSVKRANVIDPKSKDFSLLLSVLQARKARENTEATAGNMITSGYILIPPSKILLLKMPVKQELTDYLYSTKLLKLDKEKDPSFGDTRGSKYDLFEDNHPIIQTLALDLKSILMKAFNLDVFIYDSFFSIFGSGGGTTRHNHVTKGDNDITLNLTKQKYALVYYLSVGNQECLEPGVLKFYQPSEEILPSKGLITIFSADRDHSSVYGGNKDRIMVGVNFYVL